MIFTSKMFEKHLWKSDILSKDAVIDLHLYLKCHSSHAFPQVFFKHFASKNQLPGLSVSGTLVRNGSINSFVLSNFNYCFLVWMLTSVTSFRKIEAIQKKELRFMVNNCENTYKDLLNKTGKLNINLEN